MDIDALIPDLWKRYPFLDDDSLRVRLGGIRGEDVAEWASQEGVERAVIYDDFARYLALAFHNKRLPFAFCDAVMNDLDGVITHADDRRPDLFWDVYLAFDEGEYIHDGNRAEEPSATFTRPMIARIVAGFPGQS